MIIDAMDILYSNKVTGFCIVSSDSDFTRLATRLREAAMTVIGIGEKKTPNPFIVACDKFIYIEILKNQAEEEEAEEAAEAAKTTGSTPKKITKRKKPKYEKITPKVIRLISSTISDVADEDGWAFLGEVGNLIQKKQPNFDARIYGYEKLTPLIDATGRFEIERRENQRGRFKLIYVRKKVKGKDKNPRASDIVKKIM